MSFLSNTPYPRSMGAHPPFLVVKRVHRHFHHGGGAWKVAYGDFATAMMCLFIVLWLLNGKTDVRKAVGGYFVDPHGAESRVVKKTSGPVARNPEERGEEERLRERLTATIQSAPELQGLRNQLEIAVTTEGLRLELLESGDATLFRSGSARPTARGRQLIVLLGKELGNLPNHLIIEGHTDGRPFGNAGYSNWELSADRANEARRLMEAHGVAADRVTEVRGFAAEHPKNGIRPGDTPNRRISVIVQFVPGRTGP